MPLAFAVDQVALADWPAPLRAEAHATVGESLEIDTIDDDTIGDALRALIKARERQPATPDHPAAVRAGLGP